MDGKLLKRIFLIVTGLVAIVLAVVWLRRNWCLWFCPKPVVYDCPDHEVIVPPGDTAWSTVPLAGKITPIPEFHDCQRLISLVKGSLAVDTQPNRQRQYGPLVGIWVSEVLDGLPDSLEKLNPRLINLFKHQPTTVAEITKAADLTGPLVVLPKGAVSTKPYPLIPTGVGLAFAEIFAWPAPPNNPEGYRPLGIESGWNCLYLFKAAYVGEEIPTGFAARMVPVTNAETCTKQALADTLNEGKLLNVAIQYWGLPAGSYPAVGRWDWDGEHHYIGVGCHTGWCEVTDRIGDDFHSSKHYSLEAEVAVRDRRVFEVKGFYDEQRLAVRATTGGTIMAASLLGTLLSAPGPSDELIPASFTGTAVPDPQLDTITSVETFQKGWVPVAKVALQLESGDYADKLNFHQGTLPEGTPLAPLTDVYLCSQGDDDNCTGIEGAPTCDWSGSDGKWWAKIEGPPPGHEARYFCVRRVNHSDLTDALGNPIDVPGTARWQWSNTDEQLWVRCAQGCCTVH